MTKRISWWKYLATKIDDRVEAERRRENYNKGLVEMYHAALILCIGILLAIFNYDPMIVFLILARNFVARIWYSRLLDLPTQTST